LCCYFVVEEIEKKKEICLKTIEKSCSPKMCAQINIFIFVCLFVLSTNFVLILVFALMFSDDCSMFVYLFVCSVCSSCVVVWGKFTQLGEQLQQTEISSMIPQVCLYGTGVVMCQRSEYLFFHTALILWRLLIQSE